MYQKPSFSTVILLSIPPLLWASNVVLGRAVATIVPPFTLNFLRWALVLLLLLPFGYRVFRTGSGLLTHWRRYALTGLLGVALFNGLQYLALHTSSPVNVTLVMASLPVWMMIIGRVFHGSSVSSGQVVGSLLSLGGVMVVLSQGDLRRLLDLQFVPGDLLMVLATLAWAWYSWELARVPAGDPVRSHWAEFLLAQVLYGVAWTGMLVGFEHLAFDRHVTWGWTTALVVLFMALGPAIVAYQCWDAGIVRVGPTMAGFFFNLTPLIAALLSLALLGDAPGLYHGLAFALIIGGILLSSQQKGT